MMARSRMLREVVVAVQVEVQALQPPRLEPIIGPEHCPNSKVPESRALRYFQDGDA